MSDDFPRIREYINSALIQTREDIEAIGGAKD